MKKIDTHQTKIVVYIILICVMFLSVGFSSFTANNRIEGIMASVQPKGSVRITGLSLSNTSGGATSDSENYNVSNIYGNITLPNQNSTVTYKVDMTVFLGAEMKLTEITGFPSNIDYTILGYTLNDPICDTLNNCTYGSTGSLYLTLKYKENATVSSDSIPYNLVFNFMPIDQVAKIGITYYETLSDAIAAVPNTGSQTTVQLLKNRSEKIVINAGQNVRLDLGNFTLSNDGVKNVIENYGTLTIFNGSITSNATQGDINNNSGGVLYVTGGSISNTSTRQAIYNDGGRVEISGNATLTNNSTDRAAVQNLNGGTMAITGGTITSNRFHGVVNAATLTIGTKDNDPDDSTLTITGGKYGINSTTNFKYYDGTINGIDAAFNDENKVIETENNLQIIHKGATINQKTYDSAFLGTGVVVTFNPNGGSLAETSYTVLINSPIGFLPVPTKTDYFFDAWYKEPEFINVVTKNEVISGPVTFYAKWLTHDEFSEAKIGDTYYLTFEEAYAAVPNNTETTINVLRDVSLDARVSLTSTKHVIFDLGGHTIDNGHTLEMPIFENYGGVVTVRNGTLQTNGTHAAINNRSTSGSMTIENMTIHATGTRQAVYNENGTTYIRGNCHLTNTSNERSAVHNKSNGKIYIESATIVSSSYYGITNESGIVTLGSKDGSISTTNPSVQGLTYGVNNAGTFNYYDGIIKGTTNAINGTVSAMEDNSQVSIGSETINNTAYETAILVSTN